MTARDRCCSVVIFLQLLGAVVASLVVAVWRRPLAARPPWMRQQPERAWPAAASKAASAVMSAADRWLHAALGEGLARPQQLIAVAAVLAGAWTAASVAACSPPHAAAV